MINKIIVFLLKAIYCSFKFLSYFLISFIYLYSINVYRFPESRKCETLLRIFTDAYRSPQAIIIIDDIERIMEYTPVGQRFSNAILQTLLILIKKQPTNNSKLMIIATTSIANLMEDVQLIQSFNISLHINQLILSNEIYCVLLNNYINNNLMNEKDAQIISNSITKPIGIKQLLMILEMARIDGIGKVTAENFLECLHTVGY